MDSKKTFLFFSFFLVLLLSFSFISACAFPGSCSVSGDTQCGDYFNITGSNHTGELCIYLTSCDLGGNPYCDLDCSACPTNYTCSEQSPTQASCVEDSVNTCHESGFSQHLYIWNMTQGQKTRVSINSLVSNYSIIDYWVTNSANSSSEGGRCYLQNKSCTYPAFDFNQMHIYVYSNGQDMFLEVTDNGAQDTQILTMYALDDVNCSTSTTFQLSPLGVSSQSSCNVVNPGVFSSMACGLQEWFPPASTLSTAGKLAIVVIVLLIFTLGIYLFLFFLIRSFMPFSHYIVFIIDVLLCFFFLAIGYIPVAILVIVVLILIALTFFRIKSGFSAPGGK